MPATAERPRPLPIPSLLDESVPTRRRSPPPYTKLPDTKSITSPPSSVPSTPKPVLSPRAEKKAPLSPPLEPEVKKVDRPESRPEPTSPAKAESQVESKPELATESKSQADRAEDKEDETDIIDMETFQQIRELDDEEGDEFSREMVYAFFSQAEDTFKSMNVALEKKDLPTLSSLGHFLKGSSAALGVRKVQASCEMIQHYGHLRDEVAEVDISPKEALGRIEKLLNQVQKEYRSAERWLKYLYPPLSS